MSYQKLKRNWKVAVQNFKLFLFLDYPPWQKKKKKKKKKKNSTKSQILSLSGPIAFMYHLIFVRLNQVLDNQKY